MVIVVLIVFVYLMDVFYTVVVLIYLFCFVIRFTISQGSFIFILVNIFSFLDDVDRLDRLGCCASSLVEYYFSYNLDKRKTTVGHHDRGQSLMDPWRESSVDKNLGSSVASNHSKESLAEFTIIKVAIFGHPGMM
jgi:hypothetical protein